MEAVDVAVVAVTATGTVRSDADFVFFNQPQGLGGAARHLGQTLQGPTAVDGVRLHLETVPTDISALHVTLSADGGVQDRVEALTVTLLDADRQALVVLDLTGAGPEPALVAVEVYRRGDGWKARCVGQGWDEGLTALARHFGISVDDDDSDPAGNGGSATPGPGTPTPPPPLQTGPGSSTPVPVPPAPAPPPPSSAPAVGGPPRPTAAPLIPPPPLQDVPATPRPRWMGRHQRALAEENAALRAQLASLGGTDTVRVAHEARQLREAMAAAHADNAALRQQLQQLGAMDAVQLAAETTARRGALAQQQVHADRRLSTARQELTLLQRDITAAQQELAQLRATLVVTDEQSVLQEAGVYEYAHPLDDAVTYKARLADLKDKIKAMVRDGDAVRSITHWQVNGSSRDGAKMVKETSKLMLRAFNAEADNCVRGVRPHTVHTATQRLKKAAETIARLGTMMSIRVSDPYLQVRLREIKLTADYLAKVEEERERQRTARELAREEAKAAAEFEREKGRLLKEQSHYETALAKAYQGAASAATIADLQAKLDDVQAEISKVDAREANLRAGWVYVISNLGAFGGQMVKIGMTRRLDPMDRVRELGDASVPFRFDVHALIFSVDAVGLENSLHAAFADQRVNRVNKHREFFYASPAQVRDKLATIAGQHLLEYRDIPDALEWHASGAHATATTPRAR